MYGNIRKYRARKRSVRYYFNLFFEALSAASEFSCWPLGMQLIVKLTINIQPKLETCFVLQSSEGKVEQLIFRKLWNHWKPDILSNLSYELFLKNDDPYIANTEIFYYSALRWVSIQVYRLLSIIQLGFFCFYLM